MKKPVLSRVRLPKITTLALVSVLLASCHILSPGDLARGGLPNLGAPTLGGMQLWADVAWSDGWRVQRHVWSRHYRLLDQENTRQAWGSESYCSSLLPERGEGHLVVLLHGLGRTRHSLGDLHEELESNGFRVASLSYPSTRASLDEHAKSVERVMDSMPNVERVSFVTHSLGGRVVLRLLERKGDWMERVQLGSVVQIAPPNRGSSLACQLEDVPFMACLLGPSFLDVAEASTETPPEGCDFLVISGVGPTVSGWNPLLTGNDDGVVSLRETVPGFPHTRISIFCIHTLLMSNADAVDATIQFLGRDLEPESNLGSSGSESTEQR